MHTEPLPSSPPDAAADGDVPPPWVLLLAVASVLVFTASAFVAIRFLRDTFTPGSMSLGRLVVGSLVLGVLLAASRSWRAMSARDWALCVTVGVLLFGVYNIAVQAGAGRVDAGTAAVVNQVSPAVIALLAVLLLGERLTALGVVGMALAFGGVAMIALGASSGVEGDVVGVLLCFAAALAYAFGAVLEKPLVTRVPALQLTWVACTAGAVACLPFGRALGREVLVAPAADLGWLVFLGVGPTAVAFAAFAYALQHMTASALGVTTYLIAPLTVVLSWALLSETPPAVAYVGGALSLVGVAVSQRAGRARR